MTRPPTGDQIFHRWLIAAETFAVNFITVLSEVNGNFKCTTIEKIIMSISCVELYKVRFAIYTTHVITVVVYMYSE